MIVRRSLNLGDLVNFHPQPWMQLREEDYGLGLIVELLWTEKRSAPQYRVWWPNYIHGSVKFVHEEEDLIQV